MNVSRLCLMAIALLQLACSPVQYTDQNQGIEIQQIEGFIDKDNYQTLCSVSIDKFEEKKNQLVGACRIKTVQQWAAYKREFNKNQIGDNEAFSFQKFQNADKIGRQKKTRWNKKQTASLLKTYEDLLPGRFIYENTSKDNWSGTYRVSRKNLLNTIVRRQIEFIPEKSDKNKTDNTIFK